MISLCPVTTGILCSQQVEPGPVEPGPVEPVFVLLYYQGQSEVYNSADPEYYIWYNDFIPSDSLSISPPPVNVMEPISREDIIAYTNTILAEVANQDQLTEGQEVGIGHLRIVGFEGPAWDIKEYQHAPLYEVFTPDSGDSVYYEYLEDALDAATVGDIIAIAPRHFIITQKDLAPELVGEPSTNLDNGEMLSDGSPALLMGYWLPGIAFTLIDPSQTLQTWNPPVFDTSIVGQLFSGQPMTINGQVLSATNTTGPTTIRYVAGENSSFHNYNIGDTVNATIDITSAAGDVDIGVSFALSGGWLGYIGARYLISDGKWIIYLTPADASETTVAEVVTADKTCTITMIDGGCRITAGGGTATDVLMPTADAFTPICLYCWAWLALDESCEITFS